MLNIKHVYLIGSRGNGGFSDAIEFVTSGSIVHCALLFLVALEDDIPPPLDVSNYCKNCWIDENRTDDSKRAKMLVIETFEGDSITLNYGYYVFETNRNLTNSDGERSTIKRDDQKGGCVIIPLEMYMQKYKHNIILKIKSNKLRFKNLISMYWGKPYGLDSITMNLNSRTSMICTHLCLRYINGVYNRSYNFVSPTKLIDCLEYDHECDKLTDTFEIRRHLEYHYNLSLIPLFGVFFACLSGIVVSQIAK